MKLVVLDGYTENPGDLSWAELAALGELTVYDRTSYTESPLIAERIGDAEIVVMNKTPISRATIDACPNIRLIAVLATGYNVVDYNYAREKGIPVVNVPAYGTASVSQYSIALLLEICPHIGHHSASVHAGNWASNPDWCYWDYPLIELEGKPIGIIGFGRIGQAEGRIARAMGMHVLAYDVYPNDAGRAIGAYVDLDTLLAQSDVVSLHCNLTPENTGLINKENIAKMKDGAILINNAGCGYLGRMGETETAVQTRMVDLNVRAMTAMTNLVIPYMPAGGRILNTSSIASFCPTPRMTVYGASKAYVSSFTVGLSEELKRRDITVTAVCPGPMKTEFLDVGSITGRSPAFEYLPYCDQVRVAAGALRAAKAGRTMYTPRLFYKFYRLLAKVAPVKLMVKFTKT